MRLVESFRVVVFVPEYQVEAVLAAIRRETPLSYGAYAGVSWTSAAGEERFTPVSGSSPTVGEEGTEQIEPMRRVEFSLPRDAALLGRVVEKAIYKQHAWEEPVITVTESFDVIKKAA